MSNEIPGLKLSVLRKLITKFTTAPSMLLTKMFGSDKWDSEDIEWEGQVGNRGMTPFGSEDQPAPETSPAGVSEHKAHAAFWHEKMNLMSSFLNNLREPGTKQQKAKAKKYIARQARMLRNRCDRRKEWMFAQMLCAGTFTYLNSKMQKVSVDYGIPSANEVTVESALKWNTNGAKIVQDILDAQITMSNANGATIDYALFTSEVMKWMVVNPSIQTLLKKSAYGQGDLLANPKRVLGDLLHIKNMILYDEAFQVKASLTAPLAAGAGPHTIYVDNTEDFEVGATLVVYDVSAKTTESLTISAIAAATGAITATGTLTGSYKAIEDIVTQTKKFLPTTKFVMFASEVEGQKIAEFAEAPFGMNGNYGIDLDSWFKKDPDGYVVRVANKGLPVLYFEDAPYILTVL